MYLFLVISMPELTHIVQILREKLKEGAHLYEMETKLDLLNLDKRYYICL
jgi:hypothetical protein